MCQISRSQEENVAKLAGETSSEGFVDGGVPDTRRPYVIPDKNLSDNGFVTNLS